MKLADSARFRSIIRSATVAVLVPALVGGLIVDGPDDPTLKSGPGGTGGIPKSVAPAQTGGPTSSLKTPTLGQVLDATTRQPIADALVVVTTFGGEVAGLALTDDNGVFVIYLFDLPGLELAIPSEGLAGLPIEAGGTFTIFVP